jgi:ribosomal protein S18 acetylase RimI-like enzyme
LKGVEVLEGYRGKGVGKKLLEVAIKEAEKYFLKHNTKLRYLFLFTRSSNSHAINLYEKFGFKKGPLVGKMFIEHEPDEMFMYRSFKEELPK